MTPAPATKSADKLFKFLLLPFTLPQALGDKLTPDVDILSTNKQLDRRMGLNDIGNLFFGLSVFASITVIAASIILAAPVLAVTGAVAFVGTSAAQRRCSNLKIKCLTLKVLNKVIEQQKAEAEVSGTVLPSQKKPDFNAVAAVTLGSDVKTMPTIRLNTRRDIAP